MVHRRIIDGDEVVFGVQGALLGNAMTFWDHDTGSVWTQPTGEAVAGPRKGQRLEPFPVSFTSWEAWQEAHPETLAMDVLGGVTGFDLELMAVVLDLAEDAVAFPYADLVRVGVVNEVVGGLEVAVVIDPGDENTWKTFARRLNDEVLTLVIKDGQLVDRETGTVWDPVRGLAKSGPLVGESLGLLPGFTIFPSDFGTFWPDGRIWQP